MMIIDSLYESSFISENPLTNWAWRIYPKNANGYKANITNANYHDE